MKKRRSLVAAICLAFIAVLLAVLVIYTDSGTMKQLPDGTQVSLAEISFTNNVNYVQIELPEWMRKLTPLIPDAVEKHFSKTTGRISHSVKGEPRLFAILNNSNENGRPSEPIWLRLRDDKGSRFDGTLRGSSLQVGNDRSGSIWPLFTLPRRSPTLYLEPLFMLKGRVWTNLGPFEIENPYFKEYPQWTPEPLPQSRTHDGVEFILDRLLSGDPSSSWTRVESASPADPRVTRMEFSFHEDGKSVDHFRVQKVRFSDATGNNWPHELNHTARGNRAWTTNGTVEIVGALWPSEDAWKIETQILRTGNFPSGSVWSLPPISIPEPNSHNELTNQFQFGERDVRLANIVSPKTVLTNSWEGTIQYWGPETSIFGLGIQLDGAIENHRLVVVEAKDQSGNDFRMVDHRNPVSKILKAPEGATELHIKLAFPVLRKFEFLARPEFVEQGNHGEQKNWIRNIDDFNRHHRNDMVVESEPNGCSDTPAGWNDRRAGVCELLHQFELYSDANARLGETV